MQFSLDIPTGRSAVAKNPPRVRLVNREGSQGSTPFELQPGSRNVDLPNFLGKDAEQTIEFLIEKEGVPITFEGLRETDHLKLRLTSMRRLEVRVIHVTGAEMKGKIRCVVRCADGTEGSPCVTCRAKQRTVRVCC